MTRGLVSANRSRQSVGSAVSPWVRLWDISNLEPLICVCCNIAVRPELVEGPFFLLAASKKRTVLRQAQDKRHNKTATHDCLNDRRSPPRLRQGAQLYQAIRGSSLNWWNGGGLDSVHSSVVAPSPHGLSAARLPATSE